MIELTPAERRARREADFVTEVLPFIRQDFSRHPDYQSALFVVAQYWSDNAADEVHGAIVFSRAAIPRWPHVCRRARMREHDRCTRCFHEDGWFSFPYTEATFRAWEAYCREQANQDMEVAEAYLPYAVVRREPTGAIAVEYVACTVRPWLELDDVVVETEDDPLIAGAPRDPDARSVLADQLLERGDPRGELLALTLAEEPSSAARSRAAELLAVHGHRWLLGPLAAIVPPQAVEIVRGCPESIGVFFPESGERDELAHASAWSSVRSLAFLPLSKKLITPAMASLTSAGPLEPETLLDLGAPGVEWSFERLHVEASEGAADALDLLAEPSLAKRLPHLRTLVVSGRQLPPSLFGALLESELGRQLRAIHVCHLPPYDDPRPIAPRELEAWLAARPHPPELAFGTVGADGLPAGPWLHLWWQPSGTMEAWLTVERLASSFGIDDVLTALADLSPSDRTKIGPIALRPSRVFEPTEEDAARFRDE